MHSRSIGGGVNRLPHLPALLLIITIVFSFAWAKPAIAQSPDSPAATGNWRKKQQTLHQQYCDELEELARQLKNDGDEAGSNMVLDRLNRRDPQRQYIFIPSEASATKPKSAAETQLRAIQNRHADRLFAMAKESAANDAGAIAFQLLHEVLYFHPDHQAVREILAHRKTDEGWRVASERIKVKKASRPQSVMGWQRRSYLQVTTPHFTIDSIADEATTVALAEKLERWHYVWREVFFDFWSTSQTVDRWINGDGQRRFSSRKYNVIFFADRESYVRQMEPKIRGISASTGYYSDQSKASFFYAGEETTWRHELTHQLFQETKKSSKGPFEDGFLWLGEGIAMYFESLIDFGDYVTLGGFDAQRLQYSRIRLMRERFYVPLSEISNMSQSQFQRFENPGRLYSQSAGMTHFLMNDQDGRYQNGLIEFLKLIYVGRLRKGTFEKLVELDDQRFKDEYTQFLKTTNETIERFLLDPGSRTEFSLGNGQLSEQAIREIAKCTNLKLLDLSENKVTSNQLKLLSGLDQVDQLFLSNCRIEKGAVEHLADLTNLQDVDLTASDCTDADFLSLAACKRLKVVTVRATQISDGAIEELRQRIPGLTVRK